MFRVVAKVAVRVGVVVVEVRVRIGSHVVVVAGSGSDVIIKLRRNYPKLNKVCDF